MKKILLSTLFIVLGITSNAQIYVDADANGNNDGTSWANAYTQLSDAIDASQEGDEIWVAAGVYKPGGLAAYRDTTFYLNTNISLYGGFSGSEANIEERGDYKQNPTILSGDVSNNDIPGNFDDSRDDNCKHVIWTDTLITNSTIIDGFYIQNGHTDGADSTGDDRRGGGMLSYGAPVVQNCTFTANYGYFGAAAYPRFGAASNIKFRDCEFLNNRGQTGGALYINSIDNGLFENCKFQQNVSNGSGGAIYNQNSIDSFINCDFIENNALSDSRGGAIYNVQVLAVYQNCDFNNNEASARTGGALHITDGDESTFVKINECNFLANIGRWGGAITSYGTNTIVEVNGSDFTLNEASTAGGALSIGFQATMIIDSSNFESNKSSNVGGAIFLQNDTSALQLTECYLGSNVADDDGGGIHTFSGSQIEISDCIFESNSAALGIGGGFGGAISFSEDSLNLASLYIERSEFIANFASDQGGALSLVDVDAHVENSLFIYNTVGPTGNAGAISNNGSAGVAEPGAPLSLINNTFTFNEGGLAAAVVAWEDDGGMASVSMQNNIFYHIGFEDLAIEDGDPEFISLGGNLSGNAAASVFLDHNQDIVGADPLFVSISDLNFNILPESPCKDAGINDGAPNVDIRGLSRDSMVDIGCYEESALSSVNTLLLDFDLEAYPTVSSDMITLQYSGQQKSKEAVIHIYNTEGRLMGMETINDFNPYWKHSISVAAYPSGLYYVRLITKEGIGGAMIIKP